MNIDKIIAAWNAQADYMNSWQHLGEDEKLKWAMQHEREECAKVCDVIYCDYCAGAIRAKGTT